MYDWLHLHQCSKYSSRLGNSSSSVQMIQIIYRNIMADMQFIGFYPFSNLFQSLSLIF